MPTYRFRNKETDEVTELVMKIAELDTYREANPNLETIITAPMICDPVRVGARKPDKKFTNVPQEV